MEVIKLNKRQFEWFNDCDCNFMLYEKMNNRVKWMPDKKRDFLNYEHFITELNNELFDKFDFIIVTESDEIFGIKGDEKSFLKRIDCAFNCARQIK